MPPSRKQEPESAVIALHPEALIDVMLEFANLPESMATTEGVEAIFARFVPAIGVFAPGQDEPIGEVRPFRSRAGNRGTAAYTTMRRADRERDSLAQEYKELRGMAPGSTSL